MQRAATMVQHHEARRGMAGGWSGRVRRALCAGLGLGLLFALVFAPAGRSQAPGQNVGAPEFFPTFVQPRVQSPF